MRAQRSTSHGCVVCGPTALGDSVERGAAGASARRDSAPWLRRACSRTSSGAAVPRRPIGVSSVRPCRRGRQREERVCRCWWCVRCSVCDNAGSLARHLHWRVTLLRCHCRLRTGVRRGNLRQHLLWPPEPPGPGPRGPNTRNVSGKPATRRGCRAFFAKQRVEQVAHTKPRSCSLKSVRRRELSSRRQSCSTPGELQPTVADKRILKPGTLLVVAVSLAPPSAPV
jgi:hypothetical protein